MSYIGDNEVMGGIGFGDDQFDSSHVSYDSPFDPYSPIQNEPMGRGYNENNFNSSNPRTRNNYTYSPLSTYDVDTDAIYSNHMYGNPSFYRDRDALYGNATPDPARNSFNVEQDYMQDSVDYQAPGFKSTADRRYNKAGGIINDTPEPEKNGRERERARERFTLDITSPNGESIASINVFLICLIIIVIIFACMQVKQNHELIQTIKTLFLHQIHTNTK